MDWAEIRQVIREEIHADKMKDCQHKCNHDPFDCHNSLYVKVTNRYQSLVSSNFDRIESFVLLCKYCDSSAAQTVGK